MKFAFIPKAEYHIGQVIDVKGKKMRVESYKLDLSSLVAVTLENADRFERVMCICTDEPAVTEKMK